MTRWLAAVVLAIAGYVGVVGAAAAQPMVGGTYAGTHTGGNGGFTLAVALDGSVVTTLTALNLPGKMIEGTCSDDVNLARPLAILGGHFSYSSDELTINGTFSPTRPGYVDGSLEVHHHGFVGPSARQVDPTKRDPLDECSIDVKVDWNARARDLTALVVVSTPTPLATATSAPTVPPTVPATPTPPPVQATPGAPSAAAEATPRAEPAAACGTPAFGATFAQLKQAVGLAMGDAVECEHGDLTGNIVQNTTTGLSYARVGSDVLVFTNGFEHWALTPDGLVTWSGDSPGPPD